MEIRIPERKKMVKSFSWTRLGLFEIAEGGSQIPEGY